MRAFARVCARASMLARERVRAYAFVCARGRVFVHFYWQAFARHWGLNLCVRVRVRVRV